MLLIYTVVKISHSGTVSQKILRILKRDFLQSIERFKMNPVRLIFFHFFLGTHSQK